MTNIFESFAPRRAAELSGFGSVAMLDYLQRSGVFVPQGSRGARGRGRKRMYSFRDILVLKALSRLLKSGVSVANLKKSLQEFQKKSWIADVAAMEDKGGIVRYLVASEERVFLVKSAEIIVDLSRTGQLTFSFIIDLDNLHSELRAELGLPVARQEELAFPV